MTFPDGQLNEGIGQIFDEMFRGYPGMVFDLLAATEARDGDLSVTTIAHGREEPLFSNGLRHLVVFHLVAERTGHSTASTGDFGGCVA